MKKYIALALSGILLFSCQSKKHADLLVFNATIYTVDSAFSTAEAMVIADGKILATGKRSELEAVYQAKDTLDAQGKFIYPGFIDAHAHFLAYGLGKQKLELEGTTSWEDIIHQCADFGKSMTAGEWLIGRGWDQNDWADKDFPDNTKLNELYPDRPVLLTRIDGHAAIANAKALEIAGVKPGQTLTGGEVVTKDGKLTGILVDNAVDLVSSFIPAPSAVTVMEALTDAELDCFSYGLTTVDDCGLDAASVRTIDSLQKKGELNMRIYAMLSDNPQNFNWAKQNGKIKTEHLTVSSFKVYADGALGSRGACLLQPYSDKPGWSGFLLSQPAHFDSVASVIKDMGWQMCTHAIGDSGNREILNVYAKYLKGKNDLRWRVEHAQVVNPADFHLFGDNSIIPSVQPTHATSDMYWAADRLGAERVKGAYAYKQLNDQNGWIPLGTDFPVENVSTFKTFYAAVARKDGKGWPENGFQKENALSREETLRGMTIWAARANFEEKEKGSLEKGKYADFVILDQDLMKTAEKDLLQTIVLQTWLGGKKVYEKK